MESNSENSPTLNDDEDEVWRHKPLKRVKKSAEAFKFSTSQRKSLSSHSRSGSSSSQLSICNSGIPQSSSQRVSITPNVINASPNQQSSQLQTNHQSGRKSFESSKKSIKRTCSSLSTNSSSISTIKSMKMQQPLPSLTNKSEKIETEEGTGGFCPICQAPFHSILICSPGAHIQDCLQFEKTDKECPEGLSCNNTILSHYQKFNHDLLAFVRSQTIPGTSSSILDKEESKSLWTSEVMTSDSDFETPSCSRPAAAISSCSKPYEEEYEYKIKGDRVMCTPKSRTSSQIAVSQSRSKSKHTARKSAKGAINRNLDRMQTVKGEVLTPKLGRNSQRETYAETKINNKNKYDKLEQDTPQSTDNSVAKIESAVKPGNSSRKRTSSKLPTRDETPMCGTLFDYFSPSQKSPTEQKTSVGQSIGDSHSSTLSSMETKVTYGPSSISEDSIPFVESDTDIFASDNSEQDSMDQMNLKKTKPVTVTKSDYDDESSNGMDGFVKLKPKQDVTSIHGDGVDRTTDEPLFDILAGMDESSDEESESLFPAQISNFQDNDRKSLHRHKNFNPVPPAPNQSDCEADDDLPKFDLTEGALEGFCDIDWDESSNIEGQGSKGDSVVKGQEHESQEEGNKCPVNIPSKNQGFGSPVDQHEGTTNQTGILHVDTEDEDSQSLFNIPSKNEAQFPPQSNLHDEVVCSENEEEEMEVDDIDEDEEPPDKKKRLSHEWVAKNDTSAIKATYENPPLMSDVHVPSSSTAAGVGATQKHKKQGTLDSFFGCKPAPIVEPPAEKLQPNRRWKGAEPTQRSKKSDGEGKKEWINSSGKQCPFYKKMPGTSFTVDAFRYSVIPGCKAYFLSHFHYDHYGGLTKHFDQQIYCSKVTGNLVISRLNVSAECVNNLPMNTSCMIDDVEVTLLDANHCPGAVMFLFRLKSGAVYLHTGDFRADPMMEQYPELSCYHVNQLYLDTTYCDPQYKFPSQKEVIEFAVKMAVQAVRWNKKTLIVCGTYTIGKEKVFKAIAKALKCKVFVESKKYKVLECLEDNDLMSLLTRDIQSSRLHVIAMNMFNHQKLKQYLSQHQPRYDNILAFKPTGWTHSNKIESPSDIKPSKSGASTIYGIPYSEHSSYSEMKRFVQFLRADKILPTVNNGDPKARNTMDDIFKRWMAEDGRSSSPTKLKSGKIMNFFKR
nr:DNA cross-link repair 1A protein-like [Lytechinus pictus]